MFKKGQTYHIADAKNDPMFASDVVGIFRQNKSIAIRGRARAGGVQKLLDDLTDEHNNNEKRRGSEGTLEINQINEPRRNSSPAPVSTANVRIRWKVK